MNAMNMLMRMNCMLVMNAMKKKNDSTLFNTIMSSSESKSPNNIRNNVVNDWKMVPKLLRSAP